MSISEQQKQIHVAFEKKYFLNSTEYTNNTVEMI